MTVSVVIVNLNKKDLLAKCLNSLKAQTFRDFETIVVDNGSTDGSVAWLESCDMPSLSVIRLPANAGFAGGCNAGMEKARGRLIATLNNDAEADPDWLRALVETMEAHPEAGMAASKIVFLADPGRIDKVGHLLYWDGLNHGRGSGEPDLGQFEKSEEVLFPDAAAAIYRQEMLAQTGLFDDRFFAYGDDCDLGLRGRRAGWTCLYVPGARVRHVHSATSGEFSILKAFLIERNRIWVAVKHLPLPLLILSPLFTAARFGFHSLGALFGIGSSGEFARSCSRFRLALSIAEAYLSALSGFGMMWRSRGRIREYDRLGSWRFTRLIWRHRISVQSLTLGR